ncbi:MAG: archaetidylserine decarboxylase [Symbiopectobacterium sp.]
MLDKLKIALQYWLPKIALTRLAGWGADKHSGRLTKGAIDLFVRYYKVNMQEAQQPDTAAYRTFNDFFVRTLRPDVRPIDPHTHRVVQPADGVLSQIGSIVNDKLIQAKGYDYSLEALLAGSYVMADRFRNGLFATTYLSPRDYHRVHMPCKGVLREMIYVPGDLFSVNLFTADNVPNLFARNERVICLFDTNFGPMVQILVGATIVGSIETVWSGTVTPPREGIIKRWTFPEASEQGAIALQKGEEMGRFKLGSTVINLFAPDTLQFAAHLNPLSVTRVGEPFAEAKMVDSTKETPVAAESIPDMADHGDDAMHHTP